MIRDFFSSITGRGVESEVPAVEPLPELDQAKIDQYRAEFEEDFQDVPAAEKKLRIEDTRRSLSTDRQDLLDAGQSEGDPAIRNFDAQLEALAEVEQSLDLAA